MPLKYVAYTPQGERRAGTLELDSVEAAEQMLWRSELTIASLKKVHRLPSLPELLPTFLGPKRRDLISFTQELATLVESGIRLLPAIRLLQERVGNPLFRQTIQGIVRDIEAGNSFSQACGKQSAIFPPIYPRLISVAEETGRLEVMLRRVASYLERQEAMASSVKKSLSYPAVVLGVGLVAVVILVMFALPAMTGLFKEYGAELPLTTRLLVGIGELARDYGSYLFLALVCAALLGWRYLRTPSGARRWDRLLLLRFPVIKRVLTLNNMSRSTDTMAILLAGGLPLTEVVQLSARTAGNSVVRDALTQAHAELLTGEQLSQALRKHAVFPPLLIQMVGVGEQAGTLQTNLESLANFYEQETNRRLSTLTSMLEPLVIIVVGVMVGFIAMAVMSALYGLIGQIG